jgi:hypothetical protein
MRKNVIIAIAIIATTFGCQSGENTQKPTQNAPTVQLPNTPEEVVKTWETEIAQNHFLLAKQLSTGKALETVISLDSTHAIKPMEASTTQFLNIKCHIEGDKSNCDCLLEDALGQLKCTYFLVRINGQWMLDDAASEPIEAITPVSKPVK